MSTGTRLFGLLIVVALLIGAVIADWYLIRRAMSQHASGTTWQQTTGTIVTTTVTSRKTKNARRYRVAVTYEYEAGGEIRRGSTIVVDDSRGPSFRSEADARRAYPQGASVPVFVDPADPKYRSAIVVFWSPTTSAAFFGDRKSVV